MLVYKKQEKGQFIELGKKVVKCDINNCLRIRCSGGSCEHQDTPLAYVRGGTNITTAKRNAKSFIFVFTFSKNEISRVVRK